MTYPFTHPYRAKDWDTAVLIEKFEYKLSEEVKGLRQNICDTL